MYGYGHSDEMEEKKLTAVWKDYISEALHYASDKTKSSSVSTPLLITSAEKPASELVKDWSNLISP